MARVLLGIILAVLLVPAALLIWLRFGHVPVAVADSPLPQEAWITALPLKARIGRELIKTPPFQADETTFVAGAQTYRDQCAACHGYHGKPSSFGAHMYPSAPALWEKHRTGNVIGVSDDPPAETYWKVANGIRLSGMPGFKKVLTDTEIWQVSLLLANADKPLPSAAVTILRGDPPMAPLPPPAVPPAARKVEKASHEAKPDGD